jgi:sulfite reductase alpha subunit-like flavoprotein
MNPGSLDIQCHVADLCQPELVSESVVIYIVSTSGTGKEPRTMTPMWRSLLRSDLPDDFFEDLHYAVFGLGDSSYEKFCWPAKKLSRRLERLGATAICPRAEGDTQHTLGYVIGFKLLEIIASGFHCLSGRMAHSIPGSPP